MVPYISETAEIVSALYIVEPKTKGFVLLVAEAFKHEPTNQTPDDPAKGNPVIKDDPLFTAIDVDPDTLKLIITCLPIRV